ncbi:MAG: universal stress protein [Chloroflexi bacterium]|nr:universal stress protein [Chloroflexota bacterium]
MFKDILVTLCCKGPREPVMEQAIVLAKRDGAQLLGLCVVDEDQLAPPPGAEGIDPQEWRECLAAELSAAGQGLLDEFIGYCTREGVPVQTKLLVGPIAACICRQANYADLVLLGRYNDFIRRRMFVGCSPLEGTVRQATCPVMVAGTSARHPRRLLVAYDGSPSARSALNLATRIAREWDCSLSLVAVQEKQVGQAVLDEAKALAEAEGVPARCLLAKGNPRAEILRVGREQQADVVLLGAYCHGQAQELIFGGTVGQVIQAADCPVIVCR